MGVGAGGGSAASGVGGVAAAGGGCLVNGGGDERGRTESGGGTGRSQGQVRSLDRDASRRRRRRARDGGHPGRDRRGGRSAPLRERWAPLAISPPLVWPHSPSPAQA